MLNFVCLENLICALDSLGFHECLSFCVSKLYQHTYQTFGDTFRETSRWVKTIILDYFNFFFVFTLFVKRYQNDNKNMIIGKKIRRL